MWNDLGRSVGANLVFALPQAIFGGLGEHQVRPYGLVRGKLHPDSDGLPGPVPFSAVGARFIAPHRDPDQGEDPPLLGAG
ncbi:MAG: hypothetical protein IT210_16230 [Armatimonadetes bacterium]|nr:hypothetical protein [Armatimonadota bacterium]